jgi:hypothetical protein
MYRDASALAQAGADVTQHNYVGGIGTCITSSTPRPAGQIHNSD